MNKIDFVNRWLAFPSELPPGSVMNFTHELNMCVVYCIAHFNSQSWRYIETLYMSLATQSKYTDIEKADVKVFVSVSLLDTAREKLSVFNIDIIPVNDWFVGYSVLNHEVLSSYRKIILMDADVYFSGAQRDIYTQIFNSPIDSTGMIVRNISFGSQFRRKLKMTNTSVPAVYLSSFAEGLGISHQAVRELVDLLVWDFYEYFIVCNMEMFRSKEWDRYVQSCNYVQNRSISNVLMLFAGEAEYVASHLLGCMFLYGVETEIYRKNKSSNWLYILHPNFDRGTHKEIIHKIAIDAQV